MPANYRFNARSRPLAFEQGVKDGRDGYKLEFGRSDDYRAGWYHGYLDQLTRDVRAYNARHGTNYEPRKPY